MGPTVVTTISDAKSHRRGSNEIGRVKMRSEEGLLNQKKVLLIGEG